MHKLLLNLGYDIEIKKVLEYYDSDYMKDYLDFLYNKKKNIKN